MIKVKPFRLSSASDLASLGGATGWLNSPPLTAADLQGKVVVVNFWTYTCINWLRTLPYRFHARDLHLIMGPAPRQRAVPFRVLVDRQPPGANHGSDVDDEGNGTVTEQRLYQLVRQSGRIADRRFEIEFFDSGVETFAFTFG